MKTQINKKEENKSRAVANHITQKQSDVAKSLEFVDNRSDSVDQRRVQKMAGSSPGTKQQKAIQNNDYDKGRENTHIAQCALVAQLATRLSSPVQFQGNAGDLRDLIYQWNYLPGIQVQVQQTDFVGGTYKVRFTRDNGAISLAQADIWVQTALAHAPQNEASSEESSSEESSSEEL